MIGKREKNTRPAPRAPLEAQSDTSKFLKVHYTHPWKYLAYGSFCATLALTSS